ncbi:DNA recombination protein RmuC [candidate division TA06 bacterium]|uniref:DNA recombination protein RmuC n=1 Tax=candidate division TA06 bacterium TaxID=2250710 RepID=A0A933I8D1_UNCT6|nr:DNA recombination protein RmuC [candidate division TA06 bacterium]
MMIYLLLAVLAAVMLAGFWFLFQAFSRQMQELKDSAKNDQAMNIVSQWMQETKASLDSRLQETRQVLDSRLSEVDTKLGRSLDSVSQRLETNTKTVGERLDNAARVIGDVQKSLGSMNQETQRIKEIGQDIASLSQILRSPKLRGGMGEFFLGDLLAQILPPHHFELQYGFRSGEKVDAVVKLSQRLVPVDAKFPLENFKKMLEVQSDEERKSWRRKFVSDVKKHVDAISSKYILPDENTFDFALMYIPAENVYYETIIKDENFGEDKSISTYAIEKRVIPVSPNSFYAYLQAIVLGLRGMRVEESAQEIIDSLSRLKGDFGKFRDEFDILGSHIANAGKKYEEVDKRLVKFEDRLEGVEGKQIASDKPQVLLEDK